MESRLASHLLKALGQRRKVSGEEKYFIHVSLSSICLPDDSLNSSQSSVTTVFAADGGWPYGEVRDTDPIFEKEKQIEGSHPVREVSQSTLLCHCVMGLRLLIP